MNRPKYEPIFFTEPSAKTGLRFPVFAEQSLRKLISHKISQSINTDNDLVTNQKKLGILRYEIRKGKYLNEVNSVFIVRFSPATPYSELLELIRICMQEKIKQYFLLKDEFFIIPSDPVPEPAIEKKVALIYL